MKSQNIDMRYRKIKFFLFFAVAVFILQAAMPARAAQVVNVISQNDKIFFAGKDATLRYDLLTGRFDIVRTSGEPIFLNAYSTVRLAVNGGAPQALILAGSDKLSWYRESVDDIMGTGTRVVISRRIDQPKIELRNVFTIYDKNPGIMVEVVVKNRAARAAVVHSLSPIRIDPANGGGLFLGVSPANARILQYACSRPGDPPATLLPGDTDMLSCGGAAFFDQAAHRGLLAGFITHRAAQPIIRSGYRAQDAARDPASERRGYTVFSADALFDPAQRLNKDEKLASETLCLLPTWDDPASDLLRLVQYAARANAAPASKPPFFLLRAAAREAFDRDALFAELDRAASKYAPWGAQVFLVPGGWESARGDWLPATGAESEMKTLAELIHAKNFKAGLQLSPFIADADSELLKQHPGWALATSEAALPEGRRVLDISMPEVQDLLQALFRRVTDDWGYDVILVDDIRFVLGAGEYFQKGVSRYQLMQSMLEQIRRAAGPETTLIFSDGPPYLLEGIADVLALDIAAPASFTDIKARFSTMSHTAHFNHRLWTYHYGPILLAEPGLTRETRRMALSALALSGGIVEPADPAQNNVPGEAMEDFRRIAPPYAATADPGDIFNAEYPDIVSLPVTQTWGKWRVAGLFHWDDAGPAGAARDFTVNFSDLGLRPGDTYLVYDFWNDTYLGAHKDAVQVKMPAHTVRVLGVRPLLPVPQLLSSNRHITMGGMEVRSHFWGAGENTLTVAADVTATFPYHFVFHVPPPYDFYGIETNAGDIELNALTPVKEGELVHVSFLPESAGRVEWVLRFRDRTAGGGQ